MTVPPPPRIGRAFLVGCPRSGTTLLQSLVAAHPEFISFPETFFFSKTLPADRWRRHAGLASPMAAQVAADLTGLGIPTDPAPARLPGVTVRRYAHSFLRRMDRAARDGGASAWLEKTPSHAKHIAQIEKQVTGVRFLHLVRGGEAVVASLQEASERDPIVWPAHPPLHHAGTWRRYLGYSRACVGRPNHAFVSYERLVADPQAVMGPVFAFLGVAADQATLAQVMSGYGESSERVVGRLLRSGDGTQLAAEPWKQDVAGAIANRNDGKFERLFSEDERAQITAALAQERDTVAAIPFL
jgi:hypothetical protein